MENSTWQSKCGSMWQASSSQNQETASSNHRVVQETMLSWNSNSNFDNSVHSELESSFLSLLSRPPSGLQFDLQPSSNLKSITASSNNPINSNKASSFAAGIGNPLLSSRLLTPNLDSQTAEARADLSSRFSSKAMFDKCSTRSGLNDDLSVSGLSFQKSGPIIPINNQNVPWTERAKDSFLLREGSISGKFPCNIRNLHDGANVPFVSRQSSALSIGCPRVFCLGASGYLLLSSNGLLGVVCTCHGTHMSVSKFSEHSGLCNANSGDAVLMGSGETIAQWRKNYFGKIGISVPGDHSEWDWPGGSSVTASKHGLTFPGLPRNSDVSCLVGSSGASQLSGQYRSNCAFPEHQNVGRPVVDEVPYDEKQWNCVQGQSFHFKGLSSTSFSNFDSVTDKNALSRLASGGSSMSALVGVGCRDKVFQSTSGYKDSSAKFQNSFISFSDFPNLKGPGKSFNGGKREGSTVYKGTVSSNFELRLGQPSVQSQIPGSSSLLASGSKLIGAHWEAKRSVLADQLHKSDKSILKGEQSQVHQKHLSGCYRSKYAPQVDRCEGRGSVNPVILFPLKDHEECLATNVVMNGSHAIAGKDLRESHIAKGESYGISWVRGCEMDREFNCNVSYGESRNAKRVGFSLVSSAVAAEQNISYSRKLKESSHLNEVMGGSGHNKSYLEDSSLNTWQFSGTTANASDVKCLGKISCPDHHGKYGHEYPKTISSTMDSVICLASQAVLAASSCSSSSSVHSVTHAYSNKRSICARQCLLHDSVNMFAQQNLMEFPNHSYTSVSLNTFPEQDMLKKSCDRTQDSIVSSILKEQRYRNDFASIPSASGVVTDTQTSRLANWMGSDNDKSAPVAGSAKHHNFSALSQGKPFPTGDIKMQGPLSQIVYPTEQPSLSCRFSGSKCKTTLPIPGKCFQAEPYTYFPGKCCCSTQTDGLEKSYNFIDGTLATACKEPGAIAAAEATLYPSNIYQMYNYPNESSFSQDRDLQGQGLKRAECTSFQWRDVPRKMKEMCGPVSKEKPTSLVSRKGDDKGQIPNDIAACANVFNTSPQDVESPKELELSTLSSGCSAAVLTQVSVAMDNKDSPTADAAETRYSNNLVVDEGSQNDRYCSSNDALDSEQSAGICGFSSIVNSVDARPTEGIPSESSRSLIDELRLRDSIRLKQMQSQCPNFSIQENTNHVQIFQMCSRKRKKRRTIKWKTLNASFPPSSQSSTYKGSPKCTDSNEGRTHAFMDMEMLLRNDQGSSNNCACSAEPSSKRRKSAVCPSATSLERDLQRINDHRDVVIDNQTKKTFTNDKLESLEEIRRKRLRLASASNESSSVDADLNRTSSGNQFNICQRIERPIVCGKYGIISNGSPLKPAKIVCMKRILIAAKRGSSIVIDTKSNLSSAKRFKKSSTAECDGCFIKPSSVEKEIHSACQDDRANIAQFSQGETEIACSGGGKERDSLSYVKRTRSHYRCVDKDSARNSCPRTQLKPKFKELRKRSLNELTVTGKNPISSNFSNVKTSTPLWQRKRKYNGKLVNNAADVMHKANKCIKEDKSQSARDLHAVCCVCGSSNEDESNYFLTCKTCSIKVHQACYGISKVPKGCWHCRPCKVCVLCGYGGGAMTRALRSDNFVKSLLQAWNIDCEIKPADTNFSKASENQMQSSLVLLGDMDLEKHLEGDSMASHNSTVHNSITNGVLDRTVKQWVHMVCGLWTPGTRCPNVDTMSAFDVSGASLTKSDVVCSICNRSGGSCIQCRVADCSVRFHPWCAHQKGLLQSEAEGADNKSVGFYGRCMNHATHKHPNAIDYLTEEKKEFSCARTEGYKGRKRDNSQHIRSHCPDINNGCHVPQEQLNAWLLINGQKPFPFPKGLPKTFKSETEYDYRKKYVRYKQSKGWKHLIVYKSGIHGLGLYTSQFIPRNAMVVEYIGEMVGLRVADKRESEYQSGKKLQYKSACYFFRVDKEHIIDATRKGGIARFVNHSCSPNCLAKVISPRNEKKVAFFAERDIFPGEEITYDYHFNHEDEGKKIPCYCNSKNCRRFLN